MQRECGKRVVGIALWEGCKEIVCICIGKEMTNILKNFSKYFKSVNERQSFLYCIRDFKETCFRLFTNNFIVKLIDA